MQTMYLSLITLLHLLNIDVLLYVLVHLHHVLCLLLLLPYHLIFLDYLILHIYQMMTLISAN